MKKLLLVLLALSSATFPVTSIAAASPVRVAPHQKADPGNCAAPTIISPLQEDAMYGLTKKALHGNQGKGETIAIVEAAPVDWAAFTQAEKCTGIKTSLKVVDVAGGPAGGTDASDPYPYGLQLESNLDIQMLIAEAPKAKILDYVGPYSNALWIDTLAEAVNQNKASVISLSFGSCATALTVNQVGTLDSALAQAFEQRQTIVAATGDTGSNYCGPGQLSVASPAESNEVLAVGGSMILKKVETAWPNSGGGFSPNYSGESFQPSIYGCLKPVGCRELPDVSALAYDIGIWCEAKICPTEFPITGGTSAAAPEWAGIVALASASKACHGKRLGNVDPTLYALPATDFRKPAAMSNGMYNGGGNYNLVTGLGSPGHGSKIVAGLCAGAGA